MKALLIVDMQKDFMPGGALPVPEADSLVPHINQLISAFDLVIASQDWHPQNHISFVENHEGKAVGDVIQTEHGQQIMWPIHCVQKSPGAAFSEGMHVAEIDHIIYKGTDPHVDSYSAFFDNARIRKTGLADFLHRAKVDHLYVVGVATDYCVLFTVLDALDLGFSVTMIADGCAGIDASPGDVDKARKQMEEKGATIETVSEVLLQ